MEVFSVCIITLSFSDMTMNLILTCKTQGENNFHPDKFHLQRSCGDTMTEVEKDDGGEKQTDYHFGVISLKVHFW